MDFPKSVPSVGLVDGKFIDEDAVAGTPGSLIPSAWGNAVTQEILKVVQEAGLEPDEDDNTQLNAAIDQKIAESSLAFASQAEAEAGESTTKAMSPLRVFQAIAKVVVQATEGAFGWLKIGTQTQVNSGADDAVAITPKKLAAATQVQAHTAFTSAGTSTALTLAPSPAITAYATNHRFSIKFHTASGLNPTLNVSAKGAKLLKQYDSTGAKVAAVFAADQVSDVFYDGADIVLMDPLPVSTAQTVGTQGAAKNLVAGASGLNAQVTVSADELVVESAAGTFLTLRNVVVAPSFATAGAGGLDVGAASSQTISTWYSLWVIWNGVSASGLFSQSATAPTMPAGYTHKARVGWVRTDSNAANKFPLAFVQGGRLVNYAPSSGTNVPSWPIMSTGVAGTFNGSVYTPVAVAVASFIPPTASRIIGRASSSTNVLSTLAVSGEAGTYTGSPGINPPQFGGYGYNQTALWTFPFDILLKGTSIYWASADSGAYLRCFGWEDNL